MSELERRLAGYTTLVERYHATLDLMSDAALEELPRHIDDALAYARLIERLLGSGVSVVDVGSGAGLPGVVIAAALPAATVYLVERRRRRTAFLDLTIAALGLDNATVIGSDVSSISGICADAITAQAVADPATIVRLTRHLHKDPCFVLSRRGTDEALSEAGIWEAAGLPAPRSSPANSRPAGAEVVVEPLEARGSLVAVRLPGGAACLPSA